MWCCRFLLSFPAYLWRNYVDNRSFWEHTVTSAKIVGIKFAPWHEQSFWQKNLERLFGAALSVIGYTFLVFIIAGMTAVASVNTQIFGLSDLKYPLMIT